MNYPKGKLLIIGGAEDRGGHERPDMENKNIKFKHYEILHELLSVSKTNVTIITAASQIQDEVRRNYEEVFQKITSTKPKFIQIQEPQESEKAEYLKEIEETGAVFFTGGDQERLTSLLAGGELINCIKQRYQDDSEFLVAGTSAGAMAMSDIMISSGKTYEALIAQKLHLSDGFGILNHSIIDTHFIKRGRIGRLCQAILLHRDHLGIGLGEDTALIIKNGFDATCRGSGMVMIIDGKHVKKTNIHQSSMGEPIFAEKLIMHILVKGNRFSFENREIIQEDN